MAESKKMSSENATEDKIQVPDAQGWKHAVNMLKTNGQVDFQNILFATDFSSTTQLALPYVLEVARIAGARIYVAHVISREIYPMVPPEEWAGMEQVEAEFRKSNQRDLDAQLGNLPHEFLFPSGDVWENLSRIIEEKQIDLLILGTHGRTGVEKTIFGSVAERIFRQATCPVLTVGPRMSLRANRPAAGELKHILYATDFSPESLAAARYATCLAKKFDAGLVLMNSIQKAEAGQVNSAYETLREVVPLGAGLASPPKCTVERGAPAESILGVSMRVNADLIVLGIRSATISASAAAHFAHSIVYKVVTQAECPVLTIRG
jgi:nucleotide-binding universal stress UspA family protein